VQSKASLFFAESPFALRSRSAPTVAVVRGEALGGGLGLVAACDVVLASSTARFALPELLFGLSPSIILPFLRERVLPAPLRRLMLTGATVDASEALRLGLVDEVADPPDARRVVRALGRGEPGARGLVKALSPAFEAEVWAACEVTAERIASAPARARRARFAAGDAPWEVA
jgi:enoyl-CoA hydratase/carnithine racemase